MFSRANERRIWYAGLIDEFRQCERPIVAGVLVAGITRFQHELRKA
jgi:hypothetical protein